MRIHVDVQRCRAYANCILAAPDVFDIDDASGKVILLDETPAVERRMAVHEAVRNCPTQSISVETEVAP